MLVRGGLLGRARLEVGLEVLKQCYLLLELFGELVELILSQHVLLLVLADRLSFVVEETTALLLRHNLGRVVEEDACRVVGKQITKAILGAVVDPFGHPDCVGTGLGQLLLLTDLVRGQLLLWLGHVGRGAFQLDDVRCVATTIHLICGTVSRL